MFKLGGVDTSPSYLLFKTIFPLFWTLTCMIWMELTRTDAVFSRIAIVLFYVQETNILGMTWNSTEHLRKNNNKSSPKMKSRGPTPFSRGWGRAPYLVVPLDAFQRQLQLYIFAFGEKKIREKKSSCFTIRSRRQALNSLGRADLESVQGSGEGNPSPSSSSTILHHQFHDAHRRARVSPS